MEQDDLIFMIGELYTQRRIAQMQNEQLRKQLDEIQMKLQELENQERGGND
jgi:TolA-binding protein